MLEFVFFHPRPRDLFAAFVRDRGVPVVLGGSDEAYEVALPEDVDETLMAAIEAYYDEMMALNQSLFEAGEGQAGDHTAGVVLNLASGDTVYAQVDPLLLGRIMEVLTPQEFGEVVNAIVDAVEHPDARPLCRRER